MTREELESELEARERDATEAQEALEEAQEALEEAQRAVDYAEHDLDIAEGLVADTVDELEALDGDEE